MGTGQDTVAADRAGGTGAGGRLGLAGVAAAAARPADPLPVLAEDYATKIARDWNVRQRGAGFVTRFQVLQPDLRESNRERPPGCRRSRAYI